MRPSRLSPRLPVLCVAAALLAGCGGGSSIKPSEVLDERSGMTVGTLDKPIEFVQGTPASVSSAAADRHISFAYLGPVEWDKMGDVTYGLWIHVAPGNDWRFDDIRASGAVKLALDDGMTALSVIEPPALARAPYRPVASWGASAYFGADLDLLKRMAASGKIGLEVQAGGGAVVHFAAAADAHETLTRYLHARGY